MIEINNIKKSFRSKKKSVEVIKGISFKAFSGEIYGLLGPNGAGKTTTLRLAATLLKPDEGYISVSGFDTQKNSREVRDKIGFLTSEMKLSGNLSPREMMTFFGELNHIDKEKIKIRIEELSNYLDIKDYIDRPISKLSTGMKQKASIAVSIIHDPEVIIFDEPTAGLDIIASKIVVDYLIDWKKKGKTILLSTHVLSEAEKLCDRIGIIIYGELALNEQKENIKKNFAGKTIEDIFFDLAKERGMFNHV